MLGAGKQLSAYLGVPSLQQALPAPLKDSLFFGCYRVKRHSGQIRMWYVTPDAAVLS